MELANGIVFSESNISIEKGYCLYSEDFDVEDEYAADAVFGDVTQAEEFAKREAYRAVFEEEMEEVTVIVQLCEEIGDVTGDLAHHDILKVTYKSGDDLARRVK